jgi:hypothetical protein
MNTGKFLFSIALLMISISCKKPDEFPDVPVITYKDIYSIRNSQGLDQKMTVLLNFTDGDGDVGYKDIGQNGAIYDDPTSIYYNNYQAK